MEIFFGILIGIFSLLFLVTAHEFGHFLMARKNGVRVLEFGICFPPRAKAWVHVLQKDKNGKTKEKPNGKPLYKWVKIPKKDWQKPQEGLIFSLNWLPIGGFCQMDGESDADTKKGTFGDASFWGKTKILFGGVLVNWIIAILIFTVLAWFGMPQLLDDQFTIASDETSNVVPVYVIDVLENSPADRAGFKTGDKIIKVNEREIHFVTDVNRINTENAGKEMKYEIQRQEIQECLTDPCSERETTKTLMVQLNNQDNEWGYLLGISMASDGYVMKKYTWSAPIVGIGTTIQLTTETFKGLGSLVANLATGIAKQLSPDSSVREAGQAAISSAGDSVTGPIGIVSIFTNFTDEPLLILYIIALISTSLACMNVIPIPALDGGRWLMIAISRLFRKRLTKEMEEKIVSIAVIALFALMIIVTVLDITRFF